MATKLSFPTSIRGASWYQQYQETNVNLALGGKHFNVTSRLTGITANSIVAKGVNVTFISDEIAASGIDKNMLWQTMGADSSIAPKKRFTFSVTGSVAAGGSITTDISDGTVNLDDVIGVQGTSGLTTNGGPASFTYNAYVPQAGLIRLVSTNNSQNTANVNIQVTVRTFVSVQKLAQNIYDFGFRKGSALWGEWAENGIPYNKLRESIKLFYGILKNSDSSIQSPADTEIYGDYYDGLNGTSLNLSLERQGSSNAFIRGRFASQTAARTRTTPDGTVSFISPFFTENEHLSRNAIVGAYQGGLNLQYNGKGIFNHILNHELIYAAEPTLGVGTFGWGLFEGIQSVESTGSWYSLPLDNAEIYRLGFGVSSFSMVQTQSFLSFLLGKSYTMWESGAKFGTTPSCWDLSYYGGYGPEKTRVKLTNGTEQQYNGTPAIKLNCGTGANWPDVPRVTDNAGFTGAWLYSQIKNRANTKLKYGVFSYSDNDGSHSGYYNGNSPRPGTKGDGSLNFKGNANYSQETIIDSWENKKPVLIECIGTEGDAIFYVNPFAGDAETQTITVNTTNNGVQTLVHVGTEMAVWILDGTNNGGTPTPSQKSFYLNMTGYGFDTAAASGINANLLPAIESFTNMNYNGNNFSGIDGIRTCIKWGVWETADNVFQEATLRKQIVYAKNKGLKYSVCFWAVYNEALSIPTSDRATGSNGAYFKVENFYSIAPYSTVGKARLKAAVKRMAQIMAEYDNTEFISLGYGETEEFYLPIIKDDATHSINQALTGYSTVDRSAWTTYASAHGISGVQPIVSSNPADAFATGDTWSTTNGQHWFRFITDGLASIYKEFNDGVHEGGKKSVGYYADAGGAQSAWYMMYLFPKIMPNCDYYYSTEGGDIYDTPNKLMATDLNIATFPDKKYIIEFDPDDLSAQGNHNGPVGQQLNPQILAEYGDAFYSRGGNIISFAMSFSAGVGGDPENISQLSSAIYTLRQKFMNGGTFTPTPVGTTINFTQTSFKGDAGYRSLWRNAVTNNGKNKQVKIFLTY